MVELNFRAVDDTPETDNPDYDDTGCQCPPTDNTYLLEIDEGQAGLVHATCGKQPPHQWGDWQDLVVMNPTPVTVEWETDCDGNRWHGLDPCDCDHWVSVTPSSPITDQLERGRAQLLEAMSAVSEDRTCCGWAADWARTLHAEGGIWETLGRAVGWPTGNYDQWVWVSWDEAAALYAKEA
ncbi:hypothetical protein ACFVOR_37250 [Streptomyces sp. NPDC057837]|uniref:hypothetical protein n=1 Tax=Streptomyces sp. NPDC057837 TaxID=3346260 RepID=UPI0036C42AC9